jgi:hypothetical protein
MVDSECDFVISTENISAISDKNSSVLENKSRKRMRIIAEWKDNKREVLRAQGQEYVKRKGKVVQKKVRIENEPCCSSEWCGNNTTTDEEKESIFSEYYNLGDFNSQTAYLFGLIKKFLCNLCKQIYRLHEDTSRCTMSLQYYVRHPIGGSKIRMCKTAFCNIFGISAKCVRRAAQGSSNLQCCLKVDGMGKHTNRIHSVKEDAVATVKQHIRSCPRYRSHYSLRDNPHKTYITSVNNMEDMYRLYCEKCEESNVVPFKRFHVSVYFQQTF